MIGTALAAALTYLLYNNIRGNMIRVKPEVRMNKVKPQTVYAIHIANEVYRSYNLTLQITSANEPYAPRPSPNYHENGYAVDIALPSASVGFISGLFSDAELTALLRANLGYEYDVVLESDHIHIEFDYNRANGVLTYGA